MARYFVARRKAIWIEDEGAWDSPVCDHIPTVSDHEATDTGLLDTTGEPIMRAPNPIGFGKDEEW